MTARPLSELVEAGSAQALAPVAGQIAPNWGSSRRSWR
jgi:hypothetical protein